MTKKKIPKTIFNNGIQSKKLKIFKNFKKYLKF